MVYHHDGIQSNRSNNYLEQNVRPPPAKPSSHFKALAAFGIASIAFAGQAFSTHDLTAVGVPAEIASNVAAQNAFAATSAFSNITFTATAGNPTSGPVGHIGSATLTFDIADGTPANTSETFRLAAGTVFEGNTFPFKAPDGSIVATAVVNADGSLTITTTDYALTHTNVKTTAVVNFGTPTSPLPPSGVAIPIVLTTGSGTTIDTNTSYTPIISTVQQFTESFTPNKVTDKARNALLISSNNNIVDGHFNLVCTLAATDPVTWDIASINATYPTPSYTSFYYGYAKNNRLSIVYNIKGTYPGPQGIMGSNGTSPTGQIITGPAYGDIKVMVSPDGKTMTLDIVNIAPDTGFTGQVPLLLDQTAFQQGLNDGIQQAYPITCDSNTVPATKGYPYSLDGTKNAVWNFSQAGAVGSQITPTVTLVSTVGGSDANTAADQYTSVDGQATVVSTAVNTSTIAVDMTLVNAETGEVIGTQKGVAPGATATFTSTVTLDPASKTTTYKVTAVNPANSALSATASDPVVYQQITLPVGADDATTTAYNTPSAPYDVVANDTAGNMGTLGTVTFSNPADAQAATGTWTIVDNKVVFTPKDGTIGDQSITLVVTDSNGNSVTETLTVSVGSPTATLTDDSSSTPWNTAVLIPVFDNDSFPTAHPLLPETAKFTSTGELAGVISSDGKTITYTDGDATLVYAFVDGGVRVTPTNWTQAMPVPQYVVTNGISTVAQSANITVTLGAAPAPTPVASPTPTASASPAVTTPAATPAAPQKSAEGQKIKSGNAAEYLQSTYSMPALLLLLSGIVGAAVFGWFGVRNSRARQANPKA